MPTSDPRAGLRADCDNCFGLCCVAPAFARSADFAIDKPAGQACPNLQTDFRCGIHTSLRERGFPGCTVFDCLGAGQRISQVTFGGRDWRGSPELARGMYDVFPVMRQLHELLWYLTEAVGLPAAEPIRDRLGAALAETQRLTLGTPEELMAVDVAGHREGADVLLLRTSELVRSGHRSLDRRGADLRTADLIGADLRGADLGGADLTGSIFLTQAQLVAARGDLNTRLPAALTRPGHWSLTVTAIRRAPAKPRRARR